MSHMRYYTTDHLGSVRTVLRPDGSTVADNDYYPYGKRINTAAATAPAQEDRHTFSGKEELAMTPAGVPYLDFGARFYSPGTGRWLSIDPMAENYYGIGTHVYCAGNPINRIDPNGLTDYFSRNGHFIMSDDNDENKTIRIFIGDEDCIPNYQGDDVISFIAENSIDFHQSFLKGKSILTNEAAMNIYQHYNYTGLSLVDQANDLNLTQKQKESNRSMGFVNNTDKPYVIINVGQNAKSYNDYSSMDYIDNLVNRLNGHENQHYLQWQRNGSVAYQPSDYQSYYMEIEACLAQISHPSWGGTTPQFKSDVYAYLMYNILKLSDF